MGGRVGLIDTAVKTSTTGYIQRRLIKGLEDLKVEYDMTIRTNKNKIVQFAYGEDNIDTVKVENQSIPLVSMSVQDIYAHYLIPEEKSKIKTLNNIFLKNTMARYKKQNTDFMKKTSEYIETMIKFREDIFNDTSKQGLKSDPFATPESRANFSEKLKNMPPDRREEVLGEVARRRGAVGPHTLSRPIRIGGERIETVFPSQAAASRSPLTPGRLQATEEYMYKLLENNGRKASNIKGRILADANSNDPQDIADYMFSTIANKGLFKGLGTMRAGRYGRGGAIDADSNKGFSGSRKERMTMKERRSLRDVAREEFDQNEEPSDQIMDSFASGYEEIMKKYSSDSEYSINNSEIMKKADKISKRYFKDAVKDLASDGFMSEYYAGFSKLYDSKVKKRKPDFKTLYGFQEETGADRIHEAHPEAIVVSDAIGRGGLVENASEASKAMQEVALSMPTGNYRARYAFIQNALKKASS
jgi:hypothetical protein